MKVYLVIQEGVYRHDIRGVYSTSELASDAARRSATEDSDGYHQYLVCASELDTYTKDVEWMGLSFVKGDKRGRLTYGDDDGYGVVTFVGGESE